MPRFIGKSTSSTNNSVKSTENNAKLYSIGPNASFDIYVDDREASDIRTQLAALAGVTFLEADATPAPKMLALGAPAAKGTTDVHANYAGNAVVAFPGPFTSPARPRNLRLTFAASYDGGNVTVTGTDQNGVAQTELFTAVAASTVVGVKIFKTVTAAVRSAVGATANTVSIGTGDKLGLGANVNLVAATDGISVIVDGVSEAGTWDAVNEAVTPTSVPNGTKVFTALVNV